MNIHMDKYNSFNKRLNLKIIYQIHPMINVLIKDCCIWLWSHIHPVSLNFQHYHYLTGVTNVTLGASGCWKGIRTGAGGRYKALSLQSMAQSHPKTKLEAQEF